ncbi:MAG: hypothetical protein ACEQR8_12225 [Cypionkella sp.]
MPGLALAVLQLAAGQPAVAAEPAPPPDIELTARVSAREVTVRQAGEASLAVRVSPGEAPPVEVARSAPAGAERYRNLTITLRGAARVAAPFLSPTTEPRGTADDADED